MFATRAMPGVWAWSGERAADPVVGGRRAERSGSASRGGLVLAEPERSPVTGLAALMDLGGVPAVFCDRQGRVVAETTALARFRTEDAESEAMLAVARSLARQVAGRAHAQGRAERREVRTSHWSYRLVGGALDPDGGGAAAGVPGADATVVVVRGPRAALSEDALVQRYGLSPRELEVARRVADGCSTPAVARALGISPHTARHHLERVFAKLGVTSRAALTALLRG